MSEPKTLNEFYADRNKLLARISELENRVDFLESNDSYLLKCEKEENKKLKADNDKLLKEKIDLEINFERFKEETAKKNKRNAGRYSKIDGNLINKAHEMSKQGLTQRKIAENLGVSLGLVNKMIHSNNPISASL